MSKAKFQLEIVTPERVVYEGEVHMVVLPALEGDIGVLPGHMPLITMIRPGVATIETENHAAQNIFVAQGYVEVTPQKCSVLAEYAVDVRELNKEEVKARIEELSKQLEKTSTEKNQVALIKQIAIYNSMLELVETKL
jgi:F-type H+-transporting ATPase subunit epsilon